MYLTAMLPQIDSPENWFYWRYPSGDYPIRDCPIVDYPIRERWLTRGKPSHREEDLPPGIAYLGRYSRSYFSGIAFDVAWLKKPTWSTKSGQRRGTLKMRTSSGEESKGPAISKA